MKYLIITLVILNVFSGRSQTLKLGDNLEKEFSKIENPYYFETPEVTTWSEGKNIMFIGDKPSATNCDYLFLALQDSTLIGIFTVKKPNKYLLDGKGNSILSSTSDFFLLPDWVVKSHTKIDGTDKTILNILNSMYEKTLQANEENLDQSTISLYEQFKTDTTLANRHIALLFDSYQTIITETAMKGIPPPSDITLPLMKKLAGECIQLYDQIPAIVCIYMGEALCSSGYIKEARDHFKMCLEFYPNSIPLLVYNYQLEEDAAKKKKQLSTLKKNYPNHWMVKAL